MPASMVLGEPAGKAPIKVTASGWEQKAKGGFADFPPEATLDGKMDPASSWRAEGDGQWIQYDLGGARRLDSLQIAFVNGNNRVYTFDLLTSQTGQDNDWNPAIQGAKSSGTTAGFESFKFPAADARFIRLVGHGNTSEKFPEWFNLIEVAFPSADGTAAVVPPTPAVPPLGVDRAAFKDFKLSQQTIDEAGAQKTIFGGGGKLQNGALKPAYGLYLDALTACLTPEARTSAGIPVADRVVAQIREVIAPGHEPNAGAGLNGWSHHAVAQAFALAKATPEVWGQLTDDDKNRIDWIMKAMAIAGSFQFADGNNYTTSLHADDNANKNWNPNHRLYLFCVLSAAAYFGPDQLNDIYTSFSFDEYMKKFDELGFTNIKAVWTGFDWKPILENGGDYISPKNQKALGNGVGVKHPFTYRKIPLTDLAGIYCSVSNDLYSEPVTNGIEGKSWVLNNGSSPFLGQMGMMAEFNSKDGKGVRSDLEYCDQNFASYPTMLLTLKALGHWPANDATRNLEKLMYVGNEDFLYKNDTGFHSFSHGKGRDTQHLENIKWTATAWIIDLWNNYLKNRIAHP